MLHANQFPGYWWLPTDEDRKTPGILSLRDNEVELLIFGSPFDRDDANGMVLGQSLDHFWTLVDTNVKRERYNFSSGFGHQVVTATYAVRDLWLEDVEEGSAELLFSMESLQPWSQLSGFTREWAYQDQDAEPTISFHRQPVNSLEFNTPGLEISLNSSFYHPFSRWGGAFREVSHFAVTSETPLSVMDWFYLGVQPLRRLVSLATRERCFVYMAAIRGETLQGRQTGRVFGEGIRVGQPNEIEPKARSIPILFTADQLHEVTTSDLGKWFEIHHHHRSVRNYVDTFCDGEDRIRPGNYFDAIRLLENLSPLRANQSVIGDELYRSIRDAVKSATGKDVPPDTKSFIFNKIGELKRAPNSERYLAILEAFNHVLNSLHISHVVTAEVADLMANTRNCEAHHSSGVCDKAAKGETLIGLSALAEVLADMTLMRSLGFDDQSLQVSRERDRRVGTIASYL